MHSSASRPNFQVVAEHAIDTAFLWHLRSQVAVSGPHYRLPHLLKLDNRIAAHLDGLAVAGSSAAPTYEREVEPEHPGYFFGLTTLALLDRDVSAIDRMFDRVRAKTGALRGMLSAFGWLERGDLQGIVAPLLASKDPFRRLVGVAVCGIHRVDPGLAIGKWASEPDVPARSRAARVAGELGLTQNLAAFLGPIKSEAPESQFWTAWSAVLLGERARAITTLTQYGLLEGPHQQRAFRLTLQALDMTAGHGLLQELARDADQTCYLIEGSGVVGNPAYVPWLIGHMEGNQFARPAGEAFSMITGVDLALLDLDRKPPDDIQETPNDRPEDEIVDMDRYENLPWPDVKKVEAWWALNTSRFQAGTRYFMGAPVTRAHCIDVLKNGYQRQRILAAHYLCLLEPGTPLFNTSAPAWRQQRLLAKMT